MNHKQAQAPVVRGLLTRSLLRFVVRTPWSTTMAVAGVALGVMSIVAVHIISAQLVTRMDNLIPQPMAKFTVTASRDLLQARDYFALRQQWRAGNLPDVIGMAPFIHEHVHVRQYEWFGPFFIPCYLFASVYVWFRGKSAYRDNPFEVQTYRISDPDFGTVD